MDASGDSRPANEQGDATEPDAGSQRGNAQADVDGSSARREVRGRDEQEGGDDSERVAVKRGRWNDDASQVPVAAPQLQRVTSFGVEKKRAANAQQRSRPYFPALYGCRSVDVYERLNLIDEGTYGVVSRAKDTATGEIVALKKLKMEKEKEGFPITSLREINTLLRGKHENVVGVREIVVGGNMDSIYLVMEFVEHDLKALMETMKQPFLQSEVKTLMLQLLRGIGYLHDNWIVHRDLKTSNLLLSNGGILKIADFGLAREYGDPLRPMTPLVVTLWYRAIELLLGAKEYSTPIDMWSVGCIFAEFLTQKPLFQGNGELNQIQSIFKVLGTPNDKIWPGFQQLPNVKKVTFAQGFSTLNSRFPHDRPPYLTSTGLNLLHGFLRFDPARRLSAEEALKDPYFTENPLPIDPSMFPTWPAKSEGMRKRTASPSAPEGGAGYAREFEVEAQNLFNVQPQGSNL